MWKKERESTCDCGLIRLVCLATTQVCVLTTSSSLPRRSPSSWSLWSPESCCCPALCRSQLRSLHLRPCTLCRSDDPLPVVNKMQKQSEAPGTQKQKHTSFNHLCLHWYQELSTRLIQNYITTLKQLLICLLSQLTLPPSVEKLSLQKLALKKTRDFKSADIYWYIYIYKKNRHSYSHIKVWFRGCGITFYIVMNPYIVWKN